jgi:hypothetical protein
MKTENNNSDWRAVKYPDSKTWSVVGDVSIARGIKSQTDAELLASAPIQTRVIRRIAYQLVSAINRVNELTPPDEIGLIAPSMDDVIDDAFLAERDIREVEG